MEGLYRGCSRLRRGAGYSVGPGLFDVGPLLVRGAGGDPQEGPPINDIVTVLLASG